MSKKLLTSVIKYDTNLKRKKSPPIPEYIKAKAELHIVDEN